MQPTKKADVKSRGVQERSNPLKAKSKKDAEKARSIQLGSRLSEVREALDMSQLELAKRLQIPRSTISKWETGMAVLPAIHIAQICQARQVGPRKVLGLEEEQLPDSAFDRFNRVLEAEGTALASKILQVPEEVWPAVLEGSLRVSPPQMEELARAYRVPFTWLRSGSPDDWEPDLSNGISVRLRFLRICLGRPIADTDDIWAAVELSERYAKEHAEEAYTLVAQTRAMTAMDEEENGRLAAHFPFDFDWVMSGKVTTIQKLTN